MPKTVSAEEQNLKKFKKSPLAMNYVKKHHGEWNHQDWLDFLEDLKARNYFPINTDLVGLVLEEKKKAYLESLEKGK